MHFHLYLANGIVICLYIFRYNGDHARVPNKCIGLTLENDLFDMSITEENNSNTSYNMQNWSIQGMLAFQYSGW